jgi:hypothetical protein
MTPRRPWLALTAYLLAATCKPSTPPTPNPNPLPNSNSNPNSNPNPTAIATRRPPAELDTSCLKDSDCVPAPGCCPSPCTSYVINAKELPRAQKELESCPKDQPCPSAGGCISHAYLCVTGKCALVTQGDPAYHVR